MKLYLALALSLVFLTQCKNQKEATNTLEDMKESEVLQVEEATTKLESSDIVGKTFQAVLPCADCMGLQSEISFKESNQYEAKSFYLGKSENVKTVLGTYEIVDQGKLIVCRINNQIVSRFKVEGDKLKQIGSQGETTGGLADKYIYAEKTNQMVNRMWVATEVMGQIIDEENKGKVYILLSNDGLINASGGCNSMFGGYTINSKQFIQFLDMASTEKACSYAHFDNELQEALGRATQYWISKTGDEMHLIVGKAAPLAKFKIEGI